jgi:hypothetical protein
MFAQESYHVVQSPSFGRRTAKCNLKMIVGTGLIDITKSVDREIKLKGLGI